MSRVLKSVVNLLGILLFGLWTIVLGLTTWEIQQSADPMIGCPPPSICVNSSEKIKSKCCQNKFPDLPNNKSEFWQKIKFWQR